MNKFKLLLFFCCFLLGLFSCSPERSPNIKQSKSEMKSKIGGTFSNVALHKALSMPEINKKFTKNEKIKYATILLNQRGVTQKNLDEAMIILYRMKKQDFYETYLLYLEMLLENEQNNEPYQGQKFVISDWKRAIESHKLLHLKLEPYNHAFHRLPKNVQEKIINSFQKEQSEKQSVSDRSDYNNNYCNEVETCDSICMNIGVLPLSEDIEWEWFESPCKRFECGQNFWCDSVVTDRSCDLVLFYNNPNTPDDLLQAPLYYESANLAVFNSLRDTYGPLSGYLDGVGFPYDDIRITIGSRVNHDNEGFWNTYWHNQGFSATTLCHNIILYGVYQ